MPGVARLWPAWRDAPHHRKLRVWLGTASAYDAMLLNFSRCSEYEQLQLSDHKYRMPELVRVWTRMRYHAWTRNNSQSRKSSHLVRGQAPIGLRAFWKPSSPSAFILTRNSNPSMADQMLFHSCEVTGLSSELLRILRQEDCMSKAYLSEFKASFKVKKKAGLLTWQ